eukprot:TRINITY_DN2502_c0_g2_i15.p1 TRINITY_DN2502_c0_g2~~TRINITY_DN2502_c0_g2_i15.p1  ORF type:complete len:135 (+),score=33.50 TRINITY_DN2502_c0_g2_i15:326-730(+)
MEIISEYGGIALDDLEQISIETAYNLMKQSANALSILHDIGMVHFDIKPANMVYDAKTDMLKIIDMESAFGAVTRKKITGTTVSIDGKMRSTTLEYAPPEVLRRAEGLADVPDLKISLDAVSYTHLTLPTNREV